VPSSIEFEDLSWRNVNMEKTLYFSGFTYRFNNQDMLHLFPHILPMLLSVSKMIGMELIADQNAMAI